MTAWICFHTLDPLFPFLSPSVWNIEAPPAVELAQLARLVWDVTFARERTGLQPPVTPFLAIIIVLVIAAAVRNTTARWLAAISAGYLVAFTFLPADSRYLVPLLPLLCMAAATVIATRWPKAVVACALIAIAPGIAYAGYRLAKYGVPPASANQQSEWLAQRIPEYRALRLAGTDGVYACGGERLKAYAGGEFLGDYNGPFAYNRIVTGDIAQNLKRIGVRYFLVAKRACDPPQSTTGMQLIYEDADAQLWRVGSPP
jgi:hypothetical protein